MSQYTPYNYSSYTKQEKTEKPIPEKSKHYLNAPNVPNILDEEITDNDTDEDDIQEMESAIEIILNNQRLLKYSK